MRCQATFENIVTIPPIAQAVKDDLLEEGTPDRLPKSRANSEAALFD